MMRWSEDKLSESYFNEHLLLVLWSKYNCSYMFTCFDKNVPKKVSSNQWGKYRRVEISIKELEWGSIDPSKEIFHSRFELRIQTYFNPKHSSNNMVIKHSYIYISTYIYIYTHTYIHIYLPARLKEVLSAIQEMAAIQINLWIPA